MSRFGGALPMQGDGLPGTKRRWSACFVLVAGVFASGVWIVLHRTPEIGLPPAAPPGAVMIDLAPLPQPVATPPPQPFVPPKAMPATPPAPTSDVALPLPPAPPPRAPEPRKPAAPHLEHAAPGPVTAAPPKFAPAPAPASSASAPSSDAVPSWQGQLLGRLERFKRYPAQAQDRREQGVVYLRFSMDREGRVLSASIAKSSGHDDLDRETLALIHRAEPLPVPPPEVSGDPIDLTVPVQFFLQDDTDD